MSWDEKWEHAVSSIEGITALYEDRVDFGLDLYSIAVEPGEDADNHCYLADEVNTDTSPFNAAAIMAELSMWEPGHSTPLLAEMTNFTDGSYAPVFLGERAERYLLILSDGMDNCGFGDNSTDGEDATPAQLTDVTVALRDDMGVRTIVIAFGSAVLAEDEQEAHAQLNAIAASGGTAHTSFIDAMDGPALSAAMESIAEEVAVSCSYEIGDDYPEETDLDLVNVRFDGEPVPRDDGCAFATGWQWADEARTTIAFCEEACNTLRSGTVSQIAGEIACRPQDVVVIVV
jgi:hypothetical protein